MGQVALAARVVWAPLARRVSMVRIQVIRVRMVLLVVTVVTVVPAV